MIARAFVHHKRRDRVTIRDEIVLGDEVKVVFNSDREVLLINVVPLHDEVEYGFRVESSGAPTIGLKGGALAAVLLVFFICLCCCCVISIILGIVLWKKKSKKSRGPLGDR